MSFLDFVVEEVNKYGVHPFDSVSRFFFLWEPKCVPFEGTPGRDGVAYRAETSRKSVRPGRYEVCAGPIRGGRPRERQRECRLVRDGVWKSTRI